MKSLLRLTRIASLLGLLLFVNISGYSQTTPPPAPPLQYTEVRVHATRADMIRLAQMGLPADEGFWSKEGTWSTVLSSEELKKVKEAGFTVDVIHEDYCRFIAERSKNEAKLVETINRQLKEASFTNSYQYPVPLHFRLGSMAGFLTLQEVLDELDSMHLYYPNLITVKAPATATNSLEGRPIYMVKISDNPNVSESEPKVYMNSLIHAREPEGMQQLIFFMWYLLENYGTSEEIQYLVNNLEIYFVPVVNPDGYEYNRAFYPAGGGQWRKNRRNNGNGTFGVDLNRNFGYKWGYDDIGSSPYPADETYRGPSAFSEPETQVQRDFGIDRAFRIAMDFHTYSDDVLYSWCYITQYTPDSLLQVTYSNFFSRDDGYTAGLPGIILYNTNGDALDWQYGEQTAKPKTISFCTEIGTQNDGFWPSSARIIPLAEQNVFPNLMMLHFALRYAEAQDISPVITPEKQGYIKFNFKRYGMDAPANYTVSIQPLDTNQITQVGGNKYYFNPAQFQTYTDSIAYTLTPDIITGTPFKYIIKINNGLYTFRDTVTRYFGPPLVVFSDNCNSMANWTSTTWGISHTKFYSPDGSITDSPSGNYSNNANTNATITNAIDLQNSPVAVVNYMCQWNIEKGYDYSQVLFSGDNGTTWTPQKGLYTHAGSENQAQGLPVYDNKQLSWVKEQVATDSYVNKDLKIRFTLKSDNGTRADGFYFDDLSVTIVDMTGVGVASKKAEGAWLSDPVPNPATEKADARYQMPDAGSGKLILTNLSGTEIKRLYLAGPGGTIHLDIRDLASGIYLLRLESASGTSAVKKLVVIR
jgi:carboxypeptidase T